MSDTLVLYYDINNGNTYDAVGSLYGNNTLTMYFNNHVSMELHYVTDSSSGDLTEWVPWTGLAGKAIGSSIAFDNDHVHAIKGTLLQSIAVGATSVTVEVSIDSNNLNPSDKLVFYNADGTAVTLLYDSYTEEQGGYTFTLTEPSTVALEAGIVARVPQALYMKVAGDDVDNTRASEGIFIFDLYAMSHKILNELDYSNTTTLSGTFEHQIKSEGNILRTYTFPFQIQNLIDFDNGVNVPSQQGDWADKTYVQSFFTAGELIEYSVDGTTWHSELDIGVDKYYRVKVDTPNGVWSDARIIPSGQTPYIGENKNWWIGEVDTGVIAEGKDGEDGEDGLTPYIGSNNNWFIGDVDTGINSQGITPIIQYSTNGADWSDTFTEGNVYIRFSVDTGVTFSPAMRYIGKNAPNVQIQYSATGGENTWHSVLDKADFYIRFSVDGGATWSTAMQAKAYPVVFQFAPSAGSSFHPDFVVGSDKYIRMSNDNGVTWSPAYKFVGDDGRSFEPKATGLYADRGTYDAELQGFSYLVTSGENAGLIYFKISDTSGDWSTGLQFTPHGLSLEYSVDGTTWHTDATTEDLFIRFSTDNGVSWSSACRYQGMGVYTYIGFASDNIGNDFSLERSDDRDYWNWIRTDAPIAEEDLTLATFMEKGSGWTLYQGDDGITYSWLSGLTEPAQDLGKDGDWYINTSTGDIYNKAGTWQFKMNNVGKTGAGVTPRGFWDATTQYITNDMVTYQGSAYYALQDSLGVIPSSDDTVWQFYVSKGDKGDPGEPLDANFIDVTAVGGYIVIPNTNVPVKVEINDVGYDIDTCPVIDDGTNFKLLVDYFLAKANLSSYTGTYRVWRAGGKAGKDGVDGDDGATPTIINKYWYVNGVSTGVRAEGQDGTSFMIEAQGSTADRLRYPAPAEGGKTTVVYYDNDFQMVFNGTWDGSAWVWGEPIQLKGDKGDPGKDGDDGLPNTLSIGTVTTGAEGTSASAKITGTSPNQTLNLTIPKGDKGDPFTIDATGLLANRSQYDAMEEGFAYLATDTGDVYFKQSDTSGDWSGAVPFKGEKGDKGDAGTNTYVLCLCQQSPESLFDGMIWVKGGTDTPKYITAVGGVDVLTEEPADVSSLANGTFIITEE